MRLHCIPGADLINEAIFILDFRDDKIIIAHQESVDKTMQASTLGRLARRAIQQRSKSGSKDWKGAANGTDVASIADDIC